MMYPHDHIGVVRIERFLHLLPREKLINISAWQTVHQILIDALNISGKRIPANSQPIRAGGQPAGRRPRIDLPGLDLVQIGIEAL